MKAYTAAENNNGSDAEEVTAALEAYITDIGMAFGGMTPAELAGFAYALVVVHNTDGMVAALDTVLESGAISVPTIELFDNPVSVTGEDIYAAYNAGEDANKVLFTRVLTNVLGEKIAGALYNIYAACANKNLPAEEDFALVVNALYPQFGLDETFADTLITCYVDECDRSSSKNLARLLMESMFLPDAIEKGVEQFKAQYKASTGENPSDEIVAQSLPEITKEVKAVVSAEINNNLGMYEMYYSLPYTFGKLADSTTIYIDKLFALIMGSKGAIDVAAQFLGLDQASSYQLLMSYSSEDPDDNFLDVVADKFMAGTLLLEAPHKCDDNCEKNCDKDNSHKWAAPDISVAKVQYMIDSTLMTIYVRFLALEGLFIHPNSAGHQVFIDAITTDMLTVRSVSLSSDLSDLTHDYSEQRSIYFVL